MRILITLWMILTIQFVCLGQEPPTQIPITYQIQIKNYYSTEWRDVVPVSIEFADGLVGQHDYYSGFGLKTFEAQTIDSTENPKKVIVKVEMIPPMNVVFAFQILQARIKAVAIIDGEVVVDGIWSDPSPWVCLIHLGMMNLPIWR